MSNPSVTSADIGRRIKERREYLGVTQSDIAQVLDVSRVNVSKIESGQPISAESLGSVAKLLRVSVGYFYGEGEDTDAGEAEIIQQYRAMPKSLRPIAVAVVKAVHDAGADPAK
ncbi:hypothetical protein CCAX7_15070 [Capsulimonas corticalis]|uniref:Uncharacterized protein n=1 Tax=Capsulimonas corticalis TaxID=2219043 RepID=A0A402CZF8_9BACT|nr:helix-turn-helix transcriptional regulator [Capsulimonas corticalis]BDI29456.1 hypothetical protein CCAX7_15070 [Capsulimonas corticalis]